MILVDKHTRSYELSFNHLTKRFGSLTAVDDLSFTVRPGAVTGFLGPNGAGKTTTLRMLLGLIKPTSGTALIGDSLYQDLTQPGQIVGAAIESSSFHPGRSARNHLRVIAPQMQVDNKRVDEVLELVGLTPYANRRVGGYSTGMRQRLSLAAALLGDPPVLLLDEPSNGIDPEGIVWMRKLIRHLAGEGRTVLVSSHVLTEVEHTVDDVIIISGGRLVHSSSLDELRAQTGTVTHVESPNDERLREALLDRKWQISPSGRGFAVKGVSAAMVGAAAFAYGIEIHALHEEGESLEDVFLALTANQGLSHQEVTR